MAESGFKRTNSLIRGSGHSLQGAKPGRNSIVRKRGGSFRRSEGGQAVYDLILLSNVNEDNVIFNTKALFEADQIYSYIGNVVISVNPFCNMPIYDQATIDKYRGRSAFDPKLPPHIFALADNAFNDMRFRGRDQVVIISGESGAGKTEASKKIMQYVAAVSGSSDKVNAVKDKLLNTNPVLEAFGNAKTVRNDNSSRFGKYMDLQFDFHGDPAGGFITTYLLEKARVVRQNPGERNFHIFYQLLAGGEAKKMGISDDPKQYTYLNQGDSDKVRGMNDADWYKDMIKGLKFVGFSDTDRDAMFQVLGAILLLGQVKFKSAGSGSQVQDQPPQLAKLMGTTADAINQALTHNTVIVNKQSMASDLSATQAADARDTLAKTMYDRLFNWVYTRINKNIAASKDQIKAVIGVLDIYGFEILQTNSFEQFCINYCNEKLQQLFIELTLKTEQDEYLAEGIKWTPIEYFNNKVICDLVESRPHGIVALLDEESIRPGDKSDMIWLEKLTAALNTHKHFKAKQGPADRSIPEGCFKLLHYAGDVTYTVAGFLDRNTDTLFKDLSRLMFKSKNVILHETFPEGDESTWAGAAKRPPTAGKAFVTSMLAMIELLNTKIPSYVRCIKPNAKKAAKTIEDDLLRHQIQYLGLTENVRVRRAGFCFRESKKDFFWRYKMLSPKTYPKWTGNVENGIGEVFKSLGIQDTAYQMGKTKVFIKNPTTVFQLEEERDNKIEQIVIRLQIAWRLFRIRREIKTYYTELQTAFKNVKTDPLWGSKVKWPKHGPVLDKAEKFLKTIFKNWWARKMVGSLSEEQRAAYRLKLLAHGFFNKKRKGFNYKQAFKAHYCKNEAGVKQLEATQGASLFDADIVKLTKKSKPQPRVLIMTAKQIFKLDAKFVVNPKRTVQLTDIKAVNVTSFSDGVILLQSKTEGMDSVFSIEGPTVPEFVVRLYIACRELGNKIVVNVTETLSYNNTTKPGPAKTLTFQANPAGIEGTIFKGNGLVWY